MYGYCCQSADSFHEAKLKGKGKLLNQAAVDLMTEMVGCNAFQGTSYAYYLPSEAGCGDDALIEQLLQAGFIAEKKDHENHWQVTCEAASQFKAALLSFATFMYIPHYLVCCLSEGPEEPLKLDPVLCFENQACC